MNQDWENFKKNVTPINKKIILGRKKKKQSLIKRTCQI